MAKQDVLDAINATIVPNGVQGITAQSLNNVLTMMTENAGEGGGGDGALRVIVPEMMTIGRELVMMGEFSPASWEEMKSLYEQSGFDLSEYDAVVKTSFEHNANVAQQILEKGKAGQGVSVVLDQTPCGLASINISLQMEPEIAAVLEEAAISIVQPAVLSLQYMNVTPEGEDMMGGDMFECALAPLGNRNLDFMYEIYPSNMIIILNLDGSLTFMEIEEEQPSSGSGVVTFYAPADNTELTSEYKAKNAEAFSAFRHGSPTTIVAMNGEEPLSTILPISVLSNDDSIYLGALQGTNDGFSIATIVVSSNGSVTINQ
jgi:hypothetical protein